MEQERLWYFYDQELVVSEYVISYFCALEEMTLSLPAIPATSIPQRVASGDGDCTLMGLDSTLAVVNLSFCKLKSVTQTSFFSSLVELKVCMNGLVCYPSISLPSMI